MFLKTTLAALALGGAAIAVPAAADAHPYGPMPWWQHPPRMYYAPPPPPVVYAPPPVAYAPPAYAYAPPPPEPNPGAEIIGQALRTLPQIIAAAKAPAPTRAYASAVPPPAPVTAAVPDPTIRWAQQSLNVLTHAGLNVDGIAGPATTNAIVNFQMANGLAADGVVGSNTIAAITQQLNAAAALVPPAPQG